MYQKIDGYNPPNQYKLITSASDVEELLTVGDNDYSCKGKYAINGSLASVDIITTEDYSGNTNIRTDYSIVCVQADGIKEFFIGNIVKREILSPTSVRFIFNIDWYTSQFCTAYFYSNKSIVPTAHHFIERRSSNGRFTYKDEGFKPRIKMSSHSDLKVTIDNTKYKLFYSASGDPITYILIYRMTVENATLWIGYNSTFSITDKFKNAKEVWDGFCTSYGITTNTEFNSKNVVFFGFFPMDYHIIPRDTIVGDYITFGYVSIYEKAVQYACPPTKYVGMTLPRMVSKDYDRYEIRDIDGSVLFEYKVGVNYDEAVNDFKYADAYLNFDVVTPSLTIQLPNVYYSGAKSFTITAKPVTEFIDTEAVYNAEQRVYNQEMRSFTALNNLVSGLTGSLTEGAMMSAFSRSSGLEKGIIGGGVSAIGTVINYGYTELYANKKQTEIEDRNAKIQADTLLFSSDVSLQASTGGLWEVKYDSYTITQITNYQSMYGYQSDSIKTNLALNDSTLAGYIQADITMEGGLRKEVEDYICKMFSYGITFTKFSTS